MRATNLPHILRGAGLTVVIHAGADTRGQGELAGVEAIFVHHTGSAAMPGAVNVVRDGREGLWGLLSQLAVDPDGRWHYLGSRQAWHAGTGGPLVGIPANSANSRTIGIEGVSSGGSWTAAQRWSYPRGVAALADAFRLPTGRVVRHQDWASGRKTDAGVWTTATFRRDVDWHRADLRGDQGEAPGGIETMAFTDKFRDWFGNWLTVEQWMNLQDKRSSGAEGPLRDVLAKQDHTIARIDQTATAILALNEDVVKRLERIEAGHDPNT